MLMRLTVALLFLCSAWQVAAKDLWPGQSQGALPRLPANAVVDAQGKGWRCKYGFRLSGGVCRQIIPPANAGLNSRGDDWVCQASYERVGNRCVAKYGSLGSRINVTDGQWRCREGYKLVGGVCKRILMPENAEFNRRLKNGWECREGYARRGLGCAKVDLPRHAYWQDAQKGLWACQKGYFRSGQRCIDYPIPKYAEPSDTEPLGYRCRFGYRNSAGQCVKMEVPRNAMLTSDGNSWECNVGYERRGRRCFPIVYRTSYLKNEYFTDTMLCGKTYTRTVTGSCGGTYVMGTIRLCSKNQFFKGEIYYPVKKYRSHIKGKQLQTGLFVANDTLGNYCEVGLNR